jgi:hypothetical protein
MPINVSKSTGEAAGFAGAGIAILFWLFWTTIVGLFDCFLFFYAIQQLQTYSFAPVEAVLNESRIEIESDGDGTSYKPKVKFSYQIAGQQFTSERLRFLNMSFGEGSAKAMLPKTPVGGTLTAFYNPSSPDVAILKPGFYLSDLVVPIFLLPFNAISIIGALVFLDYLRVRAVGYNLLGFSKREYGGETRLRFYSFSPLIAAVGAAGGAGFVVIFPLLIIPSSWVPEDIRIATALLVIVLIVGYVYRRAAVSFIELTFDEIRGELSYLPADMTLLPRKLPLDKSRHLKIKEHVSTDSDGDNSYSYALSLMSPEGDLLPIQTFSTRDTAERLAVWLSQRGLRYEPDAAEES